MAGSANALQAAIYARLTANAALTAMIGSDSVFDRQSEGQINAMLTRAVGRGRRGV